MARKLIVEIVGDSKSYERALGRSEKASKEFGRSVTGMSRSASIGFGTLLKGAAALGVVAAATRGITSAVRSGISEYSQMVQVAAQTQAVLKSTGGSANVTAGDVDVLATSLSRLSGVDDEAIASAENLILTFKNVRNEVGEGNQIFDRAALAALDLSKAAGGAFGDLPTTAKQLAKALNDPVRGMTALGRAGVTFSQTQKDLIKGLVESGKVLEAQKVILREVESQVGGSAKAFGETLPGQLAILREGFRNTFGTLVATAVVPLKQLLPMIQQAADSIHAWVGEQSNQERIQRGVAQAVDLVTQAAKAFRDVFNTAAPIIERVTKAVGGTEKAVKLLVAAFVVSKVTAFAGAITGLSTQMLVATGRATALRAALLRLSLLGPIAIAVTVFVYRKEINKLGKDINRWVNDALPGSPFGGKGVGVDVAFKVENLSKLRQARTEMAKLRGEEDSRVIVLDRIIAALQKIADKRVAARVKVEVDAEALRLLPGYLGGEAEPLTPDVKVKVTVDPAAGNAVIAGITRAASRSESLGQQLADSIKRAAHLRDLIRADPANTKLQQRLTAELEKQEDLREGIASAARDEAKAQAQSAEAAKTARREATRERLERERAQAERRRDAAKAAQFKAIGLTAEGATPTPGGGALLKRALSLQKMVKGTALDTPQLQKMIDFLKKNLKTAKADVRAAILDFLNGISSAFDEGAKTGPLTKGAGLNTKKILADMGLSPEEVRELRGRLSSLGSGGQGIARGGGTRTNLPRGAQGMGAPLVVESHTTINLDGQQVANVVTKQQQRGRRRNPQQKRGPNRRGI